MTDIQTPAEELVGDEAMGEEATAETAPNDTSTESGADDQVAPPSGEGDKAEEAESRSKKRREERRRALEAAKAEAEERAAEARRATEELERIRKAGEGKKPPQPGDFENYDDYIAARAVFAARRANDDDRAEGVSAQKTAAERAMEEARARAAEEARRNFAESAAEARGRYADFDAVVFDSGVTIAPHIAEMIAFSDSPADLAYAVAKDRALAGKLSAMQPVEAAREIGRIEARLSFPQPRTQTKAPEPINPVRGKGGAARDPLKMSPAEYDEWRRKGGTF